MKRPPTRYRHPNYPWRRWIERGTVRLRDGRDYRCGSESMEQQARNVGSRLGYGVTVVPWVGGIVVTFRERS